MAVDNTNPYKKNFNPYEKSTSEDSCYLFNFRPSIKIVSTELGSQN